MKKLFALALSLIMLVGVLSAFPVFATVPAGETQESYTDVVTMTALYNGDKKVVANTVYSISSVEELFYFAGLCNHDNMYFKGATVILTDNITMNEGWTAGATAPTGENAKTWTPIDCFMGIFDGQKHTISGFYQTAGKAWQSIKYNEAGDTAGTSAEQAGGIFCTAGGEGVTVKNLNIDNSYFCSAANSAALIGSFINKTDNKNARIKNVHVNATIVSTSGEAAGLIGMTAGKNVADIIYIENCTVRGTINSTRRAGGLVGAARMMVNVKDCANYAPITSSATANCEMGGLIGLISAGGSFLMSNCVNYGNVSATSAATSARVMGGLVGVCAQPATIEDCISTGNISVTVAPGAANIKHYIGGLIGNASYNKIYTLRRCASLGNVTFTHNASHSYGTNVCVGGLIGSADNAACVLNFYDCVSSGSLTSGNNASGGLVGAYTGNNAIFERCLFNGTTTYTSAYTGAFIGCAHINRTGTDSMDSANRVTFTDSYHNSFYGNTLGTGFSTANIALKLTVNVTGKESQIVNYTSTAVAADNKAAINTPFDTLGCSAFTAIQLTDLNAIQNLSAFDWANTTENGWKIEKVGNKYLPLPTSVADLVATDMTEKDNGVDYDGVQMSLDKTAVRFVATVDKDSDYDAVGFEILVIKNGAHATATLEDSTVYESLIYTDMTKPEGDQSEIYTVDGKHLAALAFRGLDVSETVTFAVKTYSKTGDTVSYDDTCIVSVQNGKVFTYYK